MYNSYNVENCFKHKHTNTYEWISMTINGYTHLHLAEHYSITDIYSVLSIHMHNNSIPICLHTCHKAVVF